jgi:hypothetical protein
MTKHFWLRCAKRLQPEQAAIGGEKFRHVGSTIQLQ